MAVDTNTKDKGAFLSLTDNKLWELAACEKSMEFEMTALLSLCKLVCNSLSFPASFSRV